MATSLILHKGITTTVAKAKALKVYIEPLITKSKDDSTQNRRLVFSHLSDKKAVAELFRDVAVKVAQRPGGYTRILRIGNRAGDNAELCRLELVDYNENMISTKSDTKQKASRTRRGAAKKKVEGETTTAKKKVETETKATPTGRQVEGETIAKPKATKAKAPKVPKEENQSEEQTPEQAPE